VWSAFVSVTYYPDGSMPRCEGHSFGGRWEGVEDHSQLDCLWLKLRLSHLLALSK
jgi:hypothetical protein